MGWREEGSGTVLVAGLALAMLLLMAMVLGLGQAAVAAAKAATAADLAALAAADAYRGIVPGDPCQLAADVSARQGPHCLSALWHMICQSKSKLPLKRCCHGQHRGEPGQALLRTLSVLVHPERPSH
ncbi:Rv3654c family TadE-like protein [Arthrobacter polaris]|uniref:Rv3654c family TadE-like protein n=1 Tax=Arthrobacter polaris TaxID=2813727 RepID=UPI001F258B63|nr:Rv3654c family TadE-like protein [Arthrobacter polaris]